ncbi:MAG TPA: hypothetical protein VNA23_10365 [Anaerolineales bacterium]|nr:hypothetical protein [Anaerolineales bacterium]
MHNSLNKLKDNILNLPTPFVIGLMTTIIVVEAYAYLMPAPIEFPMDDTYIHFVYADNLISDGQLFFSNGNEKGVGATSPLWVFLLAGLKLLGIPLWLSAKVLGVMGLITVTGGIYVLFRPIWRSPFLFLAVILLSISGNLIWFSLSGMETMLFLSIGSLALLAYRQEKWIWFGILIGLMILTRPEGAILVAAVLFVDWWTHRYFRRELLVALLIGGAIAAPWFIYLYLRTGHLLPTSAIGKRFTFNIGLDYIANQNPYLSSFVQLRALVYPMAWLAYLLVFALGGKSLGPTILEENSFGIFSYSPSYWAILAWLLVIFPLLVAASRWLLSRRISAPEWAQGASSRSVVVLAVWFILHNAAYMLFMPVLGTASRYGVLNHVILWIFLALGISRFVERPYLARFLTGALVLIALANNLYWNRVYDANLEHMRDVRIATAHFVHNSLSADENCAAFDIGALRYFSQRPIVDIGGLTDPDEHKWFSENKIDLYLLEHEATCLILPGQTNIDGEGWLNFVEIAKLDSTPHFRLQQIASFEMDTERWLLGYLPTSNQQKSVVVYKMISTE